MTNFFGPNADYDYSFMETPQPLMIQTPNLYQNHFKKDEHDVNFTMYDHVQYGAYTNSIPNSTAASEQSYLPGPSFDSQSPQYMAMDVSAQHRVYSWPAGYFTPIGDETTSAYDSFSPISPLTPDLLHTPSSVGSVDESSNVFDMHFGAAVVAGNTYTELSRSSVDSTGSTSTRSLSSSGNHKPSRRSPIRTPSPRTMETASNSDHRRRFPCLLAGCSRRFTSQYTLKVHMEAHKPKPKVSFPCTQGCSERFSRQHDRLRHEVAKHGKICEFSCEDCGRFFSTSKTLANHKCPVSQGGTRWVHST